MSEKDPAAADSKPPGPLELFKQQLEPPRPRAKSRLGLKLALYGLLVCGICYGLYSYVDLRGLVSDYSSPAKGTRVDNPYYSEPAENVVAD